MGRATAEAVITLLDVDLSGEGLDALDYANLRRFSSLARHWAERADLKLEARRAPLVGLHEEESE